MKTFLTSDLHFDHANIIKYCNRPFKNINDMTEQLISNWNSVVSSKDLVYNLGDISLRGPKYKEWYQETLPRLNGRHILILGNHDYLKPFQYLECGIESVHTSLIVGNIVLAHDPAIATAIPKDMMLFCGHVHDTFTKLISPKRVLNVGCDVWDYKPIEWNFAKRQLRDRKPDSFTFKDLEKFGRHGKKRDDKI
jgi:calcineurin-like phosphoesterase family protein